ncbi:spindle and kinetochore-associated protein 3 isoform 2-T2 [Discoglossus pictus]
MSVTGNFFSKLRTLALSLEKETEQLEQVFNQDDDDYETECPMRVLHDMRSEIKTLKNDLQATVDKKVVKRQELNDIIKICRLLQQRTTSDIEQISETFQNYGYNPLDTEHSEGELTNGNLEKDNKDQSYQKSDLEDMPSMPTLEKQSTSWDLLRVPQLSDFGLSHYQLPPTWDSISDKLPIKYEKKDKNGPVFNNSLDIHPVHQAKTPKYCLKREDDFQRIEHFGIHDSSANLNDDYTIALFNKKFAKSSKASENAAKEPHDSKMHPSRDLKNILATPAHLSRTNNAVSVDSPLPPVFFTPGLKVHKKESGAVYVETEEPIVENASVNMIQKLCPSRDLQNNPTTPSHLSFRTDFASVDSPRPPLFCTPGLKVHQKQNHALSVEEKEQAVTDHTATPPLPTFETNWLKTDTTVRPVGISNPVPRPDTAPLVLNSDKYYANAAKTSSPPKMREFLLGTPPRPEMTVSITEELFKYNMKTSSPPKMSDYDKLLWTPPRPEMTACITEDVSQILTLYCDNKTSNVAPSHKYGSGMGNQVYTGKENRF